MRIILEGPDAQGKSTLAQLLAAHYAPKSLIIPSPVKQLGWSDSMRTWLDTTPSAGDWYTIYDRTPEVSEMVYGPVKRGANRSPFPLDRLAGMQATIDHAFIICMPSVAVMRASDKSAIAGELTGQVDADGNPIDADDFFVMAHQYWALYHWLRDSDVPAMHYQWKSFANDQARTQAIVNFIAKVQGGQDWRQP